MEVVWYFLFEVDWQTRMLWARYIFRLWAYSLRILRLINKCAVFRGGGKEKKGREGGRKGLRLKKEGRERENWFNQ